MDERDRKYKPQVKTFSKPVFISNFPLCLINWELCHEDIWGSGGTAPPILPSALDRGEWSASRPGRFTPGESAPSTNWFGGWVGPTAGLDVTGKRKILPLPGIEPRSSSPQPVTIRLSYTAIFSYWPRKNSNNLHIGEMNGETPFYYKSNLCNNINNCIEDEVIKV
jgi:hypothetical protein